MSICLLIEVFTFSFILNFQFWFIELIKIFGYALLKRMQDVALVLILSMELTYLLPNVMLKLSCSWKQVMILKSFNRWMMVFYFKS